MKRVGIQLFNRLLISIDGSEIPLTAELKEFIALLAVTGGEKVTAKNCWKILKEPMGCKYSSVFFSKYLKELRAEMQFYDLDEFVDIGMTPLRYCRINQQKVECDYYRMLNGEIPFGMEADFLTEYRWSGEFYHRKWSTLYDYWQHKYE